MKRQSLVLGCIVFLAAAGAASAALGDVSPAGLTGLWTFYNSPTYQTAVLGTDLAGNAMGTGLTGPWTAIGVQGNTGLYSTNQVVQNQSYNSYLQVTHNSGANGGGSLTNEYTVALDYRQTQAGDNSLFNTNASPTATNAAELKYKNVGTSQYTIGSDATGYSSAIIGAGSWHRIVLSVDNGNFYRVYVDGTKVVDVAGQAIDGDYALGSYFNLFAGNGWSDKWGLCGTVATWSRALSDAEAADLGGWIDGASVPTALVLVPEPATLAMLGLGGLLALRRRK